MGPTVAFADVLDSAEMLDPADQAALVDVLSRRLAERARARVADAVAEARREFAAGGCVVATAQDLIREAVS